jgi:hypothetical protein
MMKGMNMQDEYGNWIVCCVKGCDLKPQSLGLCVNHWRRTVKYGSPVAHKIAPWRWLQLSYEERFWLNVRKGDGCWLWHGAADKDGYGVFKGERDGVVYTKAHRYSFALHKGPIVTGLSVCHTCDVPACVNPAHLVVGNAAFNMADKMAKGRHVAKFGAEQPRAILTEEQAKAILSDPRPHSQIAAEYGVHAQTISSLKTRVSWAHLGTEKGVKAKRVSPRKGVSDKITPEIVREIRTSTDRNSVLSKRFGVSPATIVDIQKRRSWAHIE